MKSLNVLFGIILFLSSCQPAPSPDPVALSLEYAPLESTAKPQGTNLELGLPGYAKVLCSAVFVSGRHPEEAFKNSGYFYLPDTLQNQVAFSIDYNNKKVGFVNAEILG